MTKDSKETAIELVQRVDALAPLQPQALLQIALEHGAAIEVMERLVALDQQVRERKAKEAWYHAVARFQEEVPPIVNTKSGQAGAGKFNYAPKSEIMRIIQPVMGPLGLSVSFRRRYEKEYVYSNCRVSHALGHFEESGEVGIPIEKPSPDGKGASAAQRVGIATEYADRYAMKGILAIAPVDDPDAPPEVRRPSVDMPRRASEVASEAAPAAKPPTPPAQQSRPVSDSPGGRVISEPRRKRLWAIAYTAGKNLDIDKDGVSDKVHAIIGDYGFGSTDDVTDAKYDQICRDIEEWGAGG